MKAWKMLENYNHRGNWQINLISFPQSYNFIVSFYLCQIWKLNFFLGRPWYFHFCLDGFQVQTFFPVTSWIWSKYLTLPCIKCLIHGSKTLIHGWKRFCFSEHFYFCQFFFHFCSARSENIMVSPKNVTVGFTSISDWTRTWESIQDS